MRKFDLSVEKIKTICRCGAAANYNVRFDNKGNYIENGQQIVIGGNEQYKAVCKGCLEKIKRYKTIYCLDKYF